ncbi:MAG: AAA family ATPase, partial [Planctomycetota bacterium]
MKLVHLDIHNFRGIHDSSLSVFNYNLMVGPNNAGKSTVIDALRAFYEKDGFKYKRDRDFPFIEGVDEESWIEIAFRLTDTEDSSLANDYRQNDKILRVR